MTLFARLSLGLLLAGVLQGQQVRNVQVIDVSHASVRVIFESDLYCYYVKYGVTSGVHPYSSYSYCDSQKKASIIVGGLAPSTTYYFQVSARPNPDDETGICQTETCGSAEQVVTTLPEPAIHPEPPAAPQTWNPSPPDTSGYLVVPMKNGGKDGSECVAGADVPDALVHANDDIDSIFNNVPYGTVIEFPQGIRCIVPAERNRGYNLPYKPVDPLAGSLDSPQHRWIVLRTAANKPADFPPFGSRTGAPFASKMAKFIAVAPTYWVTTTTYGKGLAQLFTINDGGGQHHFWFENLEFTTTDDPALLPAPDVTDPPPYSALFGVLPTYTSRVPADVSYLVLDRIYLHGQGHPSRYTRGLTLGGRFQAMIGCSLDNLDFWQMPVQPLQPAKVSSIGTMLTIPPLQIYKNLKQDPLGTSFTATAELRAAASFTGDYLIQLGPENSVLKVLYTKTGGSPDAVISCTNCTASLEQSLSVPPNAVTFCTGQIADGKFMTPWCMLDVLSSSRYGYGWGTIGLELMDGGTGPYNFTNNFMGAVGMGIYLDAGGNAYDFTNKISYADNSNDDTVFVRNHVMFREDHRITSPVSNGYRYPVRNLFETKRSRRWQIQGNLFQNFWTYQNDGAALLFATAATAYPITNLISGVLDQAVVSNVIRHGAVGVSISGAVQYYPAGEQAANYSIENNLMYDLAGRYKYSDQSVSLHTGAFVGGARDMAFRHNTVGLIYGDMPTLLFADTAANLMEGLAYTDNITYLSSGGTAAALWLRGGSIYPEFPRLPEVNWSSYITSLDTAYVRLGLSRMPSYTFKDNVIIGGKSYLGSGLEVKDMTSAQIQGIEQQMPSGNIFPSGDTLAQREDAVGFEDAAHWKFQLQPSSRFAKNGPNSSADGSARGVDFDRLEHDLGVVTHISASLLDDTALFQYKAPDERACAVDVSADNLNWTRKKDDGGARERSVSITTGRQSATYYRILCYYQQVNDGMLYSDYTPDQITDGVLFTSRRRR